MKNSILIFLCIALVFCFASCKERMSAEDTLYRICADSELPSGETYLKSSEEGSIGYLDGNMITSLYGKEGRTAFALLEDYAIYLSSFAEPYEIAVFRCYSRSDTDTIAKLCLSRIEELRVILRDTEYFVLVDRASVTVKGKTVIMKIA